MDDNQVKNAMSEIKSQLRSASPAQLAKLSSAAAGLLSYAISPELESQVKDLQTAVDERAQEAEKALSSRNISSNQQGQYYAEDKDKALDTLAAVNDKIYEKFRLTSKEDLANKKKDTKNLSELEEATKAGKPVSEALKKKLLKTPEQIQAAKARNQQMVEAEKAAQAEAEARAANIERLKREAEKAPSHKREEIQAQIKQESERQVEALSVVGEVHEHYEEHLKQAEHLYNTREASLKSGVNQEILNDVEKQFTTMIAGNAMERIVKLAEETGKGGMKHVKWLKSKQVQEAVMQDPEVTQAIMSALKKQQNNHQQNLNSAGSIHPPNTPNVKQPIPNKSHGGHGI